VSTGSPHHHPSPRSLAELARFLSEPTVAAYLAKPKHIDEEHDCPDLAGYSVDGRTLFVDRHLAKAKPAIAGAPFERWIEGLIGQHGHEPVEKAAIDQGYDYLAAHEDFATPAEHLVLQAKGIDPKVYEKQLRPWIKREEVQRIERPPLTLDCHPYYDHPDANDLRVLKRLREFGVVDAMHQDGEFHPTKIGGKQAPDGHWYVEDKREKGKYLRIVHDSLKHPAAMK
jgi:hypothetical protein